MDKGKLELEINNFLSECSLRGKPVNEYCLNEAYPGDSSTSYFFDLKADWIKSDGRFKAIEFFTDVMFDVMPVEARRKIFSIRVFTKEHLLQCDSGEIIHVENKAS